MSVHAILAISADVSILEILLQDRSSDQACSSKRWLPLFGPSVSYCGRFFETLPPDRFDDGLPSGVMSIHGILGTYAEANILETA